MSQASVLQITRHGVRASGGAAAIAALRGTFRASACVRLTALLDPPLLSWIQAQIAGAEFEARAHGTISTELCMRRNTCLGALTFLINETRVLRFVEAVSGCPGLTAFAGRVYRVCADRRHFDSWHGDSGAGRQVGMSVNLGREPYEGGVFEIRRRGSTEPLATVANVGPGDAILFSVAGDLEHRITPMRGAVAKTACAGWFGTAVDYRDVVRPQTSSRSAS
jgi:hypothetical protein